MTLKTVPFHIVSELDSDAALHEYLSQIFADGDSAETFRALGHVARARGRAQVAADSRLGRENLYNALKPGAKPRFDTILRVCHALGVHLESRPIQPVA